MHTTPRSKKRVIYKNKEVNTEPNKTEPRLPGSIKDEDSPGSASGCKKQSPTEQRFPSRRTSGKRRKCFEPERDLRAEITNKERGSVRLSGRKETREVRCGEED